MLEKKSFFINWFKLSLISKLETFFSLIEILLLNNFVFVSAEDIDTDKPFFILTPACFSALFIELEVGSKKVVREKFQKIGCVRVVCFLKNYKNGVQKIISLVVSYKKS